MTVNASAISTRITIGGQDWSPAFLEAEITDNHADESALITTQATITLVEVAGLPGSMDDRVAPYFWQPGQLITLDVKNTSGAWVRHPRGYLRILSAEYQPPARQKPGTMVIKAGCPLVYLMADELPLDPRKARIAVGTMTQRHTIVNNLLQAETFNGITFAGLSSGVTSLPYPINYRIEMEKDYISTVGALLFSAGYVGWVDSGGVFRVKPKLSTGSALFTLLIGRDEIHYERWANQIAPRGKIRCSGTSYIVRGIPAYKTRSESQIDDGGKITPGLAGDQIEVGYTIFADYWDEGSQKKTKIVNVVLMEGLSFPETHSISEILTQYIEARWLYEQTSEHKLLKATTEVQQLRGLVYPEWFEAVGTQAGYWKAVLIESGSRQIDCGYDSKGRLTKITDTTWETEGAILSGIGFDWSTYSGVPNTPSVSLKVVQEWRETRPGTWELSTQTWKPLARANPGAVTSTTTKTQLLGLILVKPTSPQESSSGGSTPPAAETAPQPSVEAKQVFGEAYFPLGIGIPKVKNVELKYLAGVAGEETEDGSLTVSPIGDGTPGTLPEVQCRAIAAIEGKILYGRFHGQQIAVDLRDDLASGWTPLALVDCDEGSQAQTFLIDGATWLLTRSRAGASFDGIWLGARQEDGSITPALPEIPVLQGGMGCGGTMSFEPVPQPLTTGGMGCGGTMEFTVASSEAWEMHGGLGLGGTFSFIVSYDPGG